MLGQRPILEGGDLRLLSAGFNLQTLGGTRPPGSQPCRCCSGRYSRGWDMMLVPWEMCQTCNLHRRPYMPGKGGTEVGRERHEPVPERSSCSRVSPSSRISSGNSFRSKPASIMHFACREVVIPDCSLRERCAGGDGTEFYVASSDRLAGCNHGQCLV